MFRSERPERSGREVPLLGRVTNALGQAARQSMALQRISTYLQKEEEWKDKTQRHSEANITAENVCETQGS